MPAPKLEPLSEGEWKVMRIVWERKACDARDVYQQARKDYGWAASTAKTFLRRLVQKGYLETTRIGNSFLYRPIHSSFEPLRLVVDNLLAYAMDETVAPLLAYIVKKNKLSSQDLAELRALLDECDPGREE
ncbi:MAG: BlaI/MecI/CopY family transcriptional regulator [bacterium]